MRQRGKVSELALTFCGGKGALQAMAANYGMFLSDEDAQLLVDLWRAANPWAQDFSRKLWETMRDAHEAPGTLHTVNGKIGFIYLADYLGGSLLMQLPSGRFLTYRALRWETVHEYDDNDQIIDIEVGTDVRPRLRPHQAVARLLCREHDAGGRRRYPARHAGARQRFAQHADDPGAHARRGAAGSAHRPRRRRRRTAAGR